MTIVRTRNTLGISWTATGYQLQMKTNLSSLSWTDVLTNTVNLTNVTLQITSDTMFFRLVQVGAPGGPTLAIQLSGNVLTLSWPADHLGWFAQSNSVSVVSPGTWFDIPGSDSVTTLSLPMNAARTNVFYRLRHP